MTHKILLLSLAILTPCHAGTMAAGKEPMKSTAPAAENLLSFFGGKLVFDFQEKVRGEYRENNFYFTVMHKATKSLGFHAEYSRFFAGNYLTNIGASSDANFIYVQANIDS